MYTQCPKCDAAFRITVDVLQQARGQVRCGSCDEAFNALDHLTEEAPVVVGPEAEGADDLERSQLLETLDRLAGSEEVRIEDTGVEWLVVEDGENANDTGDANDVVAPPPEEEAAADPSEETATSMRWVIEDANDLDTEGELDDDAAASTIASDEPRPEEPRPEEPRYDDNTELPDDFEEQHHYSAPVQQPQRRASDQFEFVVENDDAQADLELSEPDDWSDLLEDIHGAGAESATPVDASVSDDDRVDEALDSAATAVDPPPADAAESAELRDDTKADSPADTDEAASLAATMGPAPDEDQEIAMVASQLDDLLETMGSGQGPALDLEALRSADPTSAEPADAADADDEPAATALPDDDLGDMSGRDQVGEFEVEDNGVIAEVDVGDHSRDDAWVAGEDEDEFSLDESPDAPLEDEDEDEDAPAEEESADASSAADEALADDSLFAAAADALEGEDLADYAAQEPLSSVDEERASDTATEASDAEWADSDDATSDVGDIDSESDADGDTIAAEDSDAEAVAQELAAMTGNMAIDADFVRALKDGDFESTMVDEDGSPLVETIVMEGESVSGALTSTSTSIRESLKDPGSLLDTYISIRKDDERPAWPTRKFGIGALVVLFTVLIGQIVHHSRDSLATNDAFQQLFGPIYDLLGSPLVPNWDIKGWQFEATNGGTDEDNSVLTIYSRLSNRAESALPYPLVHVSLTDRYEEIIGSRMLEPGEYLAGNADPERLVAAGADFTAVITIAEPSADATGFKLNVCYPAGAGDVRCAIEDFKTP